MDNVLSATGRRKDAIARVYVTPGTGKRIVNGKEMLDYLKSETLVMDANKPFALLECGDKYDIKVTVKGGGLSGQTGAIRLGIARVLASVDEESRSVLKKAGLLTRDARTVERKKYGQAGARKKFQFSKR